VTLARLRRHCFIAIFFCFFFFLLLLNIYFLQGRSPLVQTVFKGRFQLTQTTRIATMSAGVAAIRVPAKGTHSASVIWLHGLGDSGDGWKFMSKFFDLPVYLSSHTRLLTF
jgi:Phospholipase/Carboxylesterase